MSLSFPTLPEQPGLTTRYSALLYTLIHLLLEIGNRGPRLGPQDKAPRFISHVPLFLWGGNYAVSRRTAGIYTYRAFKWEQGQAYKLILRQFIVIWKHGMNGRQGKIGI